MPFLLLTRFKIWSRVFPRQARRRENQVELSGLRMEMLIEIFKNKRFLFPFSGSTYKDILGFPFVSIWIYTIAARGCSWYGFSAAWNCCWKIFSSIFQIRLQRLHAINFGREIMLITFGSRTCAHKRGLFVYIVSIQRQFKCFFCASLNCKNNGVGYFK